MLLSPCKIGNREFESDYHHCPHFPAVSLFQTKYLEIASCAVSLLNIYLDTSWTQTSAAAKLAKNQWKFNQSAGRMWIKLWGRVEHQPQNSTSNILRGWKKQQIFIYFKFHFHHDGGPGRRSYFEVFFSERGKFFVCKIWSPSDTPNRFFANKCHIFYKCLMGLFFPQYLYSCSPVRTGMIRFGSKLSKN